MAKDFRLIKRAIFDSLSIIVDGIERLRVNDSSISFSGLTRFSQVLSPPQLTANQNDYNPTGIEQANVLRLSSDASRDITGIVTEAHIGRILFIHNVGTQNIVLKDGVTSTAAYRFALAGDFTLVGDSSCIIMYDATSLRWRLVGIGG